MWLQTHPISDILASPVANPPHVGIQCRGTTPGGETDSSAYTTIEPMSERPVKHEAKKSQGAQSYLNSIDVYHIMERISF